jgi:two-component system, OmpR family, sensor histidine kinase KdpD
MPPLVLLYPENIYSVIATRRLPLWAQWLLCILSVFAVALASYAGEGILGYKVVSLILLMVVSVQAALFDIWPVLFAAIASAIIWNYFFIPPLYTFHIGTAEDMLLFLMYFAIALVNAVLTYALRKAEKTAHDREEKAHAIRLYNTLLNSLSHELLTPVATIMGAVDTLREQDAHLTAHIRQELLGEVDTATDKLNRQVQNLLNMSRLESGTLRPIPDWCDMTELVYGEIDKLPMHPHHQIIVDIAPEIPLFRLDAGFTALIVYNLLHNALLYTPPGSLIRIQVTHVSAMCRIAIADNGPGFPPDEMPSVFDKFYRLRRTGTGGNGLGLSIVKGFAEAQGGSVQVANNTEGGATFTVDIPADTSYINQLKNE